MSFLHPHIQSLRSLSFLAGLITVTTSAFAGVEVKENLGKGDEDKWPKKSDVPIVENPTLARVSVSANGKTMIGQSFKPKRNITLDKIFLRYSTKSDAGTVYLRIQEVPSELSGAFEPGKDLFAKPLQFGFTINTQGEPRFLELKFTGTDQISLKSGKSYVFEIAGSEGTQFFWHRRAADEYEAGEAYVNRVGLTGNDSGRDMALAIVSK